METAGGSAECAAQRRFREIDEETGAISRWLAESETVVALLLKPDGGILACNRAALRIFPVDPAGDPGASIWKFLASSEAGTLRDCLEETAPPHAGPLLFNIVDAEQNEISFEVELSRCDAGVLLVATRESRLDSGFQAEIFGLTNDLSLMVREATRQNRDLTALNETIARLADTDALTGLANSRKLNDCLQKGVGMAESLGLNVTLAILDLDYFKSVNDRYGHLVGDQVLIGVAGIFEARCRTHDLAARYGGEEFAILLPATSLETAMGIAERIREEVARVRFPDCPEHLTISIGLAAWAPGETARDLFAHADAALYKAKRNGRNRVEVATGSLPSDERVELPESDLIAK